MEVNFDPWLDWKLFRDRDVTPVTRGQFNLFFAFRSRVSRLVPRADNAGENSRRIIESITIAVRNDHLKPTELQFRNPRNTSGNTATFHTRSRFSVVAEPATSCAARGLDRPKTGHCFFFFFFFLPVYFRDPRYNPRVDGVVQAGEILFRRAVWLVAFAFEK